MSTVNNGPQIVRSGLVLDLDASYMRSYSPNVHPNPTNIFAWSGTGNNNCTLSGDSSTTRQYGSIPLKMVMTGTDPYTGTYNVSTWNLAPAANGQTWTLSFYAKGSETLTGNCYIFGANSSGNYIEAFATSFTVTNTWQRFSLTSTFSNASTAYIQIRFGGASGQVGKTIWWDGVQVERASSATTFNPYYFGNTVWRDVSTNNNNGTLSNVSFFNQWPYSFDTNVTSVTDPNYLTCTSITFADTATYSFEFWIKNRTTPAATFHSLMGRGSTNPWLLIEHLNTTGANWRPSFRENNATFNNFNAITDYNISNQWAHIIFTVDSSRNISFYLNGSLRQTLSTAISTTFTITRILGGYQSGVGDYFSWRGLGSICRIYNKTLSLSEILQNYNATKTRFGL
jgi:hypothetical protein